MSLNNHIVHISFECLPHSKWGGLADAVFGLGRGLSDLGFRNTVYAPDHSGTCYGKGCGETESLEIEWPCAGSVLKFFVIDAREDKLGYRLIFEPHYFQRVGIYHEESGKPYPDGIERGCFFAFAALKALQRSSVAPRAVFLHDWHGCAIACELKKIFPNTQVVFVIHNFQFKGDLEKCQIQQQIGEKAEESLKASVEAGLPRCLTSIALKWCDKIVAVSPNYQRELVSGALENENTLSHFPPFVTGKMHGILNGIEQKQWSSGKHISAHHLFTKKQAAKDRIRKWTTFAKPERRLAVMIARLVRQKGIDFFSASHAKSYLGVSKRVNVIMLGKIGEDIQGNSQKLRQFESCFPESFRLVESYSDALAQELFLASDFFLMPSLFEPCGLTQMYALANGSVPVVNPVGGLVDTIQDVSTFSLTNEKSSDLIGTEQANGFVSQTPDASSYFDALERAVDFEESLGPEAFATFQWRLTQIDNSWGTRAQQWNSLLQLGDSHDR